MRLCPGCLWKPFNNLWLWLEGEPAHARGKDHGGPGGERKGEQEFEFSYRSMINLITFFSSGALSLATLLGDELVWLLLSGLL